MKKSKKEGKSVPKIADVLAEFPNYHSTKETEARHANERIVVEPLPAGAVEHKVVQATPDTRRLVAELTRRWPTGPTYDDILKNVESTPKGGTGVTFGPKIVPAEKPRNLAGVKVFATYLVGIIGLIVAYRTGFLQEVVKAAGWVTYAVAALVVIHIATAFVALRRSGDKMVDWLAKIDATILTVGFLGKLYAIAAVTGAINTADPSAAAAGIGAIAHGVSQALFSTMAGLAIAAWTHCATMVVSHRND